MPFIEIERIWTDDDEMVQLDVRASNDAQVGVQDFYIYPEDFLASGKNSKNFLKLETM